MTTPHRTIAAAAEAFHRQDWATVAQHALSLAAANPEGPGFAVMDAGAMAEPLPDVQWLVKALDVCPGAPTLIAGYGFSAKTVAAQSMAVRLAAAADGPMRSVWGMFQGPYEASRVIHIDWEQGPRLTRHRFQRLARGMGFDLRDLGDRLGLVSLADRYLDNPATKTALLRAAEGRQLAIVDSFRAACPGVDENSSDVRGPLDVLGQVSDATGCCFVVLHHARKPNKDNAGGAKYAIRGSGALFDACQSVLIFAKESKDEPTLVRHEKARISGHQADDFTLSVEDVGQDALRVLGRAVVVETEQERTAKKRAEDKARLLAYLDTASTARGIRELKAGSGLGTDATMFALGELLRDGSVVNSGTDRAPCYHRKVD